MIVDLPDLPANRNRNIDHNAVLGGSVSSNEPTLPDLPPTLQMQRSRLAPVLVRVRPVNEKVAAVASRLSIWGAFLT